MDNKKIVKKGINWPILIGSFIIVHLTAFFGSRVTSADSAWYNSIKPEITPPGFVFGIVWTFLFLMIWLSLYFACTRASKNKKLIIRVLFLSNLVLNFLWSYFFFGMQNPAIAFIDIIFLWASILTMVLVLRKISKLSSWLLVPYLLWVSFATILNYLMVFK
jgi:tryptophan-rich sensory protein